MSFVRDCETMNWQLFTGVVRVLFRDLEYSRSKVSNQFPFAPQGANENKINQSRNRRPKILICPLIACILWMQRYIGSLNSFLKSYFLGSQPQGIPNDRYRTEAHGQGRDHGGEQNSKDRVQYAGGNGNPQHIVHQGKEQVLSDVLHCGLAQVPRLDDPFK